MDALASYNCLGSELGTLASYNCLGSESDALASYDCLGGELDALTNVLKTGVSFLAVYPPEPHYQYAHVLQLSNFTAPFFAYINKC